MSEKCSIGRALKFFISHIENFGAPQIKLMPHVQNFGVPKIKQAVLSNILSGQKFRVAAKGGELDDFKVGWSFRISISTGEVNVQFQREKEGPDTVSEHHRCPKSVR